MASTIFIAPVGDVVAIDLSLDFVDPVAIPSADQNFRIGYHGTAPLHLSFVRSFHLAHSYTIRFFLSPSNTISRCHSTSTRTICQDTTFDLAMPLKIVAKHSQRRISIIPPPRSRSRRSPSRCPKEEQKAGHLDSSICLANFAIRFTHTYSRALKAIPSMTIKKYNMCHHLSFIGPLASRYMDRKISTSISCCVANKLIKREGVSSTVLTPSILAFEVVATTLSSYTIT